MNRDRWTGTLLLLGFLVLISLHFWDVLTQEKLMFERDLPIFFFPNLKLWVEAVKSGELPLWNPYSFSGQPLFASLQTCILYPPNVLLLLFPVAFAFNLTIVLHFFLSGWFIYLFCRELGGSRTAANLSALSFSLGGFLLSIHNVLNTFQSVTWTPLVFFFFLRALRQKSWKYSLLSSITILVQFLGAGIEAFLLTQIAVLILTLYPKILLTENNYAPLKWRFQMIRMVWVLFLGLGAVQIIPFWEMVYHSVRRVGLSFEEATRWSLGWSDLLYVFLPDFFWRGYDYYRIDQNYLKSIYLGIIPILMALFFFLGRDRRKGWFSFILIVSLLLALGKNTPFYGVLYSVVPGIETIRYPAKFFFFFSVFICLLNGLGWDALADRLKSDPLGKLPILKKASLTLAFFFVLILLILSFFHVPIILYLEKSFPISPVRPWVFNLHNLDRFSFIALLTFLFFVFLADRKVSIKKGQILVITLLTLDLFLANWEYYRRVDQKAYFSLSPNLQAVLSDPERGRIFPDPILTNVKTEKNMKMEDLTDLILKECFYFDYPLVHRIFNASGFGVMTYQPYQELLDLISVKDHHLNNPDILRMMNVKHLLWHEPLPAPHWRLLRQGEPYALVEDFTKPLPLRESTPKTIIPHLYENKKVLPRAFLISNYVVVKNKIERLQLLQKKGFDPAQTVLLEEVPDPPRPSKESPPDDDRVSITNFSLNQIGLKASCAGPRLLLLSEAYYPGWRVWVNGKEGKIFRANHAFRAVALDPGYHVIAFKYRPFSVCFGLLSSSLTLIGLLVSLVFFRQKLFN
jgi:hypothetical protein